MLLIVLQTREPLCLTEMHLIDIKDSCIGSVLLRISPKVRPPSKWIYLGKFVTGKQDSYIWKDGGR